MVGHLYVGSPNFASNQPTNNQPSHRHPQKYKKSPNPNKTARKLLKTNKEADKQPPILLNPPVKTHYAYHPHVSSFGAFLHRGQNKNRQNRQNPLNNPFMTVRCPNTPLTCPI